MEALIYLEQLWQASSKRSCSQVSTHQWSTLPKDTQQSDDNLFVADSKIRLCSDNFAYAPLNT